MAGLPWIRAYTSIRTDKRSLVLGRLLGDSHAYARILDLRLWLADNAPAGRIDGPHAPIVVEEAVGWRGTPGEFATAAKTAGFLRDTPARDGGLEDVDWVEQQGAHVEKVLRDRAKPDGRRKSRATPSPIPRDSLTNPAREASTSPHIRHESPSHPVRDSGGESRELRVESRELRAETDDGAAGAAPPPVQLEDHRPPAPTQAVASDRPPIPLRPVQPVLVDVAPVATTSRSKTSPRQQAARQGAAPSREPSAFVEAQRVLIAAFQEARGTEYVWDGGKDSKALNWLLYGEDKPTEAVKTAGPKRTAAELAQRFRNGLGWKGYPMCNTVHDLRHNWNTYGRTHNQATRDARFGVVDPDSQGWTGTGGVEDVTDKL